MAGVNLNKKTFRKYIILMTAAAIILLGIIIAIQFNLPALILGLFSPADTLKEETIFQEETGPWGDKEYEWEYLGTKYTASVTISDESYKENYEPIGGTNIPADLINYVITEDSDNAVSDISSQLESYAESGGFNESETIDFVLSFVRSISYQTDSEYLPETKYKRSKFYPRTPVVTLAEQTGDSEDLSILASSILKSMGYASALYYYPAAYDRHSLIPNACALGIVGISKTEPYYTVNTTYKAKEITFTDYDNEQSPSGSEKSSGWYYGSRVSGNKTDTNPVTIENPIWVLPVKAVWVVDTSKKGTPVSAYNSQTPVIIQDDSLWSGKEGIPENEEKLDLELAFDLVLTIEKPQIISNISSGKYWKHGLPFDAPVRSPINVTEMDTEPITEIWREEAIKYLESSWYSSGVSWDYNYDKWNLYEQFINIGEVPSVLYKPDGTTEITTQAPWRITYNIDAIYEPDILDPDHDFITPYADLCIAVYEITDSGIKLVEMTGYGGHSGSGYYGISNVYSPGKYAIGVFSRNVLASVEIEYHGKKEIETYTGGI